MLWLTLAALAADAPDPHVLDVPRRLVAAAASDPAEGLPQLVEWLVDGSDDPTVRARRIHDWIALNIAYDRPSFDTGARVPSDVGTTLGRKLAVCAGYAELFEEMATLAGLEAVTLSGYGRGIGYDPFAETIPAESNHAWNAVKLGDTWRLLDVTWDAGDPEGDPTDPYSTDWWLTDALVFRTSHLPIDPKWQLATPALTREELLGTARLGGGFAADLSLLQPLPPVLDVAGPLTLRFGRAPGLVVGAWVTGPQGEKLTGAALADADGDAVRVRVAGLDAGEYRLHVSIRAPGEETGRAVLELGLRSAGAERGALPVSYARWDAAFTLVSPDAFPDAGPTALVLRLPGVADAQIIVGEQWTPMTRDGDQFSGAVPPDGWKVAIPAVKPPTRKRGQPVQGWSTILAVPPPVAAPPR